jgi:nucleoside-diphosphate-sugar epimerase
MHFLITGCAGFIGSHLTDRLLHQGHKVTSIDNFDAFYPRSVKMQNIESALKSSRFKFVEGDLSKDKVYEGLPTDIDCVVHLAGKAGVRPSVENPEAYIESNITATQNLLKWMNRSGLKKMVFASSSSVYGNNKSIPFRELDAVDHPISPYAFTKKACELLNHVYHHLYQIDVLNLRFFTVYGPRQRPDLAIHKFINAIRADEPITLFGDGSSARDYTFIDDIIAGVLKAIDYTMDHQGVFEIINIGNNNPVQLRTLVDKLYALMGKEPKLTYAPMQSGDVERTFADVSKAELMLGYKPKTSLDDGLLAFKDWKEGISMLQR